ncbi:putative ribonuclease H protein [Glycine soja]
MKDRVRMSGDWKLIWELEVPPRVKVFLWRLCSNCLPTKTNLRTRGIDCSFICPLCEHEIESTFHTVFSCSQMLVAGIVCR